MAFTGPNVIPTPSQLRSSYIYTVLKLFQPFEGKCEADVAPGKNEFDTPALSELVVLSTGGNFVPYPPQGHLAIYGDILSGHNSGGATGI